jgi:hypothetical protein
MEEMIHRERVQRWKGEEMRLVSEVYRTTGSAKLLERLGDYVATIMTMALHMPGAYDFEEKPSPEMEEKPPATSDEDLLKLLGGIPDAL